MPTKRKKSELETPDREDAADVLDAMERAMRSGFEAGIRAARQLEEIVFEDVDEDEE